jgi:hypothetical protein
MATNQPRQFEDKPAVRERVPLMIGLYGASGSGKTFSALRLAAGFQRVSGGDTHVIDTESRRSLHYAERFKFRHVEFHAPFGPLDYLSAIEHCAHKGASTIVVDSMSHEHEGPGGVLEMHETILEGFGGKASDSFRAWAKPKAERRRMINTIMQLPCNFIFCFRAKEKTKPGEDEHGKKTLIDRGFMPIAGEEFVYEMTATALLLPNAGGVPTWNSSFVGEKQMIKLPGQFAEIFREAAPLSEDIGERMAKWAAGDVASGASKGPRDDAPTFGSRLEWAGREEWRGKPLTAAGLETLADYELAAKAACERASGPGLVALQKHIAHIGAAIAEKEAASL